jgi:UDP-glucose:(heptosyl)LPS alpha-1,3-glucosyltransferase
MKVGLIIERFACDGGGAEQWTWHLAHALARRGHAVTVLAFDVPAPAEHPQVVTATMPWHADRLRRARTAHEMLATLSLDVTHDIGVCTRADILHSQSGSRLANAQREWQSRPRLHRVAAWLDLRRLRWLRQLRHFESLRYAPSLEHSEELVVAVSQVVVADLLAWHRVSPAHVRVVPNGIDTTRFVPLPPAERDQLRQRFGVEGRTVLLFSAYNPALKGFFPLLEALARARVMHPELLLVAIGKAPDARMISAVRRWQLEETVRFDGSVPDPLAHYQMADLFTLPSWHDACSLSVLEACACGVPVITTRTNGASELLADGLDGRIVDVASNVDALAAAITALAAPATRERMGAQARRTAETHDFSRNVDRLEQLYHEVVRRRSRPLRASEPV